MDERTMKIETKCHECIFATFNNNKQQLGCELGRSEKFSAQGKTKTTNIRGTKALEISTVCNTYRDKEWEEAWHEHNDVQSNWQHPKDDVRNFVTCKVDFVIVENTDDDIDKVEEKFMITLESIIRHDILPKSVVFMVNNDNAFNDLGRLLDVCDMFLVDSGIDYQLVRNIEEPIEYYRLLDVGVKKTKGNYYTHYELGVSIPIDIISYLDYAINTNMWTVSYVEHEDPYKTIDNPKEEVVQTAAHRILGGNEGAYIGDKIAQKAEAQKITNKMMFTWEQLHAKRLS